MKIALFIIALATLTFTGCKKNNQATELEKKVATLEKLNKENDKKVMALAVTVQVLAKNLNHFDHSPLWNFFNASEFWENTYGIDPFRCNNACGSGYNTSLLRCNAIQDSTERNKCITETNLWLINCITGCPPVNP
jgi:hypothetical protein